jgi:O-antigen/teichoic acid export membrane protein
MAPRTASVTMCVSCASRAPLIGLITLRAPKQDVDARANTQRGPRTAAKILPPDPGAKASPSLWRRVRRDVVLLGAGNVCIVLAQLGFRSILIATFVPATYGRLTLILSIYNTVFLIGASGLPNSVARYISISNRKNDSAIVRSAFAAGLWPTAIAAALVASVSAVLLGSSLAFLFAAIGLSSLVYSLICTGILRGRSRIALAASILPVAAIFEVVPLAVLALSGIGITLLSAFGVFCFGNLVGLVVGAICVLLTAPRAYDGSSPITGDTDLVPSSRELLGFSLWLGAAGIAIAIMPLIMRSIAVIDSYAVVAAVDIALILLSIPQRLGVVIVQAAVPHATRALDRGDGDLTISRREHLILVLSFATIAAFIAFTPAVRWVFTSFGHPGYAKSTPYLALAVLAGPARILYGLVEGTLVAHGDGRFLATNAWCITIAATMIMLTATLLGHTLVAFAVFVLASWAVYIFGLRRIHRLSTVKAAPLRPLPSWPRN